jgi:hypothetical protein
MTRPRGRLLVLALLLDLACRTRSTQTVTKTLSWNPNPSAEMVTAYHVTLDGTAVTGSPTTTTSIPVTYTVADTHTFAVTATNATGTSAPAQLTINGIPDPPQLPTPTTPQGLKLTDLPPPNTSGLITGEQIIAGYKGAFVLPLTTPGCTDSGNCWAPGAAFTIRDYGGTPYLLGKSKGNLVKITIPALKTSDYNRATVAASYGNVWGSTITDYCNTGNGTSFSAMQWVEEHQTLYWTQRYNYNTSRDDCPSMGVTSLTDTSGTTQGVYRLANQSVKTVQSGVTVIPASYASQYLQGKRVAWGAGGMHFSSISGSSMGPSLTATGKPTGASLSAISDNTPLFGYWPYQDNPGGSANRPRLPALPFPKVVNPPHQNPNTYGGTWPLNEYWQYDDEVQNGLAWVDLADRRGVIGMVRHGMGMASYISAVVYSQAWRYFFYVYDPNQFTPASGMPRQQVLPTSEAEWTPPDQQSNKWPFTPVTFDNSGLVTFDCPNNSGVPCNPQGKGIKISTSMTSEKVPVSTGYQSSSIQAYVVSGASPDDFNGMLSYANHNKQPGVYQNGARTQQESNIAGAGYGAADVTATTAGQWGPAGTTQGNEMKGIFIYRRDLYVVMDRLVPCCQRELTVYVFGL